MLAKCHSGAVYGVDAQTVEIEVCASDGAPQFTMVGLPDQAVKEAKDRVSTAIGNSNITRGLIQGGNGREKAEKGGKQGV